MSDLTDSDLIRMAEEQGTFVPPTQFRKDPVYSGSNFNTSSAYIPQNGRALLHPENVDIQKQAGLAELLYGAVKTRSDRNLAYILGKDSSTPPHELQHVAQHEWEDTTGKSFNRLFENNPTYSTFVGALRNQNKRLNSNSLDDPKELFATLAQWEASLPEGQTLKNHPVMSKLMSPEMKHLSDIYINPHLPKITEPTYFVPNEKPKELGIVEKFQRWMRNKTK
jgi:hypothetical protein